MSNFKYLTTGAVFLLALDGVPVGVGYAREGDGLGYQYDRIRLPWIEGYDVQSSQANRFSTDYTKPPSKENPWLLSNADGKTFVFAGTSALSHRLERGKWVEWCGAPPDYEQWARLNPVQNPAPSMDACEPAPWYEQRIADLEAAVVAKNARIKELEANARDMGTIMTARVSQDDAVIAAKDARIKELESALESRVNELEVAREVHLEEALRLRKQIADKDARITHLGHLVDAKNAAIVKNGERIVELDALLCNRNHRLSQLDDRVKELEATVAAKNAVVAQLEADAKVKQGVIDHYAGRADKHYKERRDKDARIRVLESSTNGTSAALADARAKLLCRDHDLAALRRSNAALEQRIKELEGQCAAKWEDFTTWTKTSLERIRVHKEDAGAIARLAESRDGHRATATVLEAKVVTETARIKELETQLANANRGADIRNEAVFAAQRSIEDALSRLKAART